MFTTDFLWDDGQGLDLHLLRGTSSPSLLTSLVVIDDLDPAKLIPVTGPGLPADFTGVTFSYDVLPAALAQQKITLDPGTGKIDVAAASPAAPVLRNFVVHAQALINLVPSPDFIADIRVHVHDSVSKIWLTPAGLTVRVGADGQKFTVLALFDDGVVGDVTAWTNLTWDISPAGAVQVDRGTGALAASPVSGPDQTVSVALPAGTTPPVDPGTAVVRAQPTWAAQDVEFVDPHKLCR